MDKRKLSIRVGLLILSIFAINFLAIKFYWYSLFWWFDIPMHFLGGLWLGLTAIYLYPPTLNSAKSIWKVFGLVLVFILAWEVYEFFVDDTLAQNGFNTLDTISDVLFGSAGCFTATLYFFTRIVRTDEVKV